MFAAEKDPPAKPRKNECKILIADDEVEVHNVTRLVLKDYTCDEHGLEILSAYSAEETRNMLNKHPDIALILLDVVMETDDAGLQLVHYIRETLANPFIRIILRTGQPGKAPERVIITQYDINDYKDKTELTATKLFTVITASLRAYIDLRTIEKNRRGLETIIAASSSLFELQSLKQFASGILQQLQGLLQIDDPAMLIQTSGFSAALSDDDYRILAGTGTFESCEDQTLQEALPPDTRQAIRQATKRKTSTFSNTAFIGYSVNENGSENILYMEGCEGLSDIEKNLILIFSTNVSIAFDNICLNQEIIDTQREVVHTLGEVVETRSQETAKHVLRVAEYSRMLALKYGMNDEEAELLCFASPMHDVGKIAIPDAILNKPGRLTPEEFDIIKTHAAIGNEILKNSKRPIMKTAAAIALQHHEHWNGKGYPQGLRGEQTPICGRITALVDVFDALGHKRIYKDPWPLEKILALLREERGEQFDPQLVDLWLEHLDEFLKIKEKYAD
ncbi:MAG: DUF3369 domain-containing protein [Deltaproteobacteria bacterium]|nr:DUF3369 domain-containing protein [Deltaproteobacteria bacterium]